MHAEELLLQGDLSEALGELQEAVRSAPSEGKLRVFLFQLLAVMGDWRRALAQLKVAGDLDPLNLAMVQTYRDAVKSEIFREEIFGGTRSPLIFGKPPEWTGLLLEALRLTALEAYDEASELRTKAFDLAPGTAGEIDQQPFNWIADADPRLGPMLEAVINGAYYWIPIEHLARLEIEEPCDLRDLVWAPAHFTWTNQGESVGLIPARYPGSEKMEDPLLKMARKTAWDEPNPGIFLGVGQRMLATDNGDYPLLNTRQIILRHEGSFEPS